jgi:hypothetical protein
MAAGFTGQFRRSSRPQLCERKNLKTVKIRPKMTRALLALVFTVTAIAASAVSSSPVSAADDSPRHCVIALDKLHSGEKTSRVTGVKCSNDEKEIRAFAPQTTVLMTFYVDSNFTGYSLDIKGDAGLCDHEGYGLRDTGDILGSWVSWRYNLSSYKVWNNCFYSRAYFNTYYGEPSNGFGGNVPYVGNAVNDHVWSIQVWSER